jgi:hypothetical protein
VLRILNKIKEQIANNNTHLKNFKFRNKDKMNFLKKKIYHLNKKSNYWKKKIGNYKEILKTWMKIDTHCNKKINKCKKKYTFTKIK